MYLAVSDFLGIQMPTSPTTLYMLCAGIIPFKLPVEDAPIMVGSPRQYNFWTCPNDAIGDQDLYQSSTTSC